MTSAWAFRKAISNLHFDLVVSKLLKITAALSRNQNMLAAPQDCELKPQIYPRRKLEKRIKSQRGREPFFLSPLFPPPHPVPRHTQTMKESVPSPRERSCGPTQPELTGRRESPMGVMGGGQGEAGGQEEREKGCLVRICVTSTP